MWEENISALPIIPCREKHVLALYFLPKILTYIHIQTGKFVGRCLFLMKWRLSSICCFGGFFFVSNNISWTLNILHINWLYSLNGGGTYI